MRYVKENYENFFGKNESESSYGKPTKLVEQIPELLGSGTVLDIGAGDGRHSLFLADKGFEVTAVDISEAGLEKLQRLAEGRGLSVKTEAADLSRWSIEHDYDAFVSIVVLQHLPTEQALRIVSEMKEHTTPGGLNAITLFTKNGDRYGMDRVDDPDAFYPDDGWLEKEYADWEILDHGSSEAPLIGKFREDGAPMTNVVEKVLARKPSGR